MACIGVAEQGCGFYQLGVSPVEDALGAVRMFTTLDHSQVDRRWRTEADCASESIRLCQVVVHAGLILCSLHRRLQLGMVLRSGCGCNPPSGTNPRRDAPNRRDRDTKGCARFSRRRCARARCAPSTPQGMHARGPSGLSDKDLSGTTQLQYRTQKTLLTLVMHTTPTRRQRK